MYTYIEHVTFHITGWMIFPPIIGMPFGPGRWLHNRIGGSSQHSDQNPAKILGPKTPYHPCMVCLLFTYIWLIFMVNVGKYTIHGCCGYCEYFRYWYWKNDMFGQQFWKNMHIANADFQCKIYYIHTKDVERQCSLCKNTFSPFIAMNAGWWRNFAGMACAGHFPCCRLHQLGGTSWIFWECPGSMKSNYLT